MIIRSSGAHLRLAEGPILGPLLSDANIKFGCNARIVGDAAIYVELTEAELFKIVE